MDTGRFSHHTKLFKVVENERIFQFFLIYNKTYLTLVEFVEHSRVNCMPDKFWQGIRPITRMFIFYFSILSGFYLMKKFAILRGLSSVRLSV